MIHWPLTSLFGLCVDVYFYNVCSEETVEKDIHHYEI